MGHSVFDPTYEALPDRLPVFPLPGALLLPGGRLPLNIFEPRYLAMVDAALSGGRLIGMIQPQDVEPDSEGAAPEVGSRPLYQVGCAGRIVAFSESDDGRYLITLAGLIRFRVRAELPDDAGGFRIAAPDFRPYRRDLAEPEESLIDREELLAALRLYFGRHGLKADWAAIEKAPNDKLVTSLAMLCPFEPSEKQVLLEASTLTLRAEAMTTILRLGAHDDRQDDEPPSRPN